jgi:hypothetical protein
MSFLRAGDRVEWIRSEKASHPEMEIRLLLGRYDADGRDVQANFGIGENSVRGRTTLDTANTLPKAFESGEVRVGRCFQFCPPFGTPEILLYGLILLRRQAVGARTGIWHLKPEFSSYLQEPWKRVFTHGRAGTFRITGHKVEPDGAANRSQPIGSKTNRKSAAAGSGG